MLICLHNTSIILIVHYISILYTFLLKKIHYMYSKKSKVGET